MAKRWKKTSVECVRVNCLGCGMLVWDTVIGTDKIVVPRLKIQTSVEGEFRLRDSYRKVDLEEVVEMNKERAIIVLKTDYEPIINDVLRKVSRAKEYHKK